ncbi:MAG: hypothetical protein M0Z95_27150 [Actinomycetota bacterium]|jgi:hypothetical protein|nr:hypothetical protein [Actinomycetota bacterium]
MPTAQRWIVAVLSAALVALVALIAVQESSPAPLPMSTLHVVAGPVAAGSDALVVARAADGNLDLAAVDPSSQTVVWRLRYSASEITAGVYLQPTYVAGVTVDLVPTGGASSRSVVVEGVSVASGSVLWRRPAQLVTSPPTSCADRRDICVVATGQLQLISPTSGAVVHTVDQVERTLSTDLYELTGTPETWLQIGASGTVRWTRTLASIFGPGFSSNYGWALFSVGNLDYGSVGYAPQGRSDNLALAKTVGFSAATGRPVWSVSGELDCGGPLAEMAKAPVVCRYTGIVQEPTPGALPSFAGITLVLEGLDPTTGAITWSQPVTDVGLLSLGTRVPFTAATQLVVTTPSGSRVLLNLRTGRTTAIAPGAVFWCANSTERYPTSGVPGGDRIAVPSYGGCTSNGVATGRHPAQVPATAGVRVGQQVIWLSANGLVTSPGG